MFKESYKKTSLSLNADNYKLFKDICRVNNSDASKEIRKFIEDYIKKNQQTVIRLKVLR